MPWGPHNNADPLAPSLRGRIANMTDDELKRLLEANAAANRQHFNETAERFSAENRHYVTNPIRPSPDSDPSANS